MQADGAESAAPFVLDFVPLRGRGGRGGWGRRSLFMAGASLRRSVKPSDGKHALDRNMDVEAQLKPALSIFPGKSVGECGSN